MAKPNTNICALYGYAYRSSIIMITDPPGDRHTLNIVILARNLLVKHRLFGITELVYVPTEEQLADGMTKALPYPTFLAICLNNYLYYYEFSPHWS